MPTRFFLVALVSPVVLSAVVAWGGEVSVAVMDEGWARVKAVYVDPDTKCIYSVAPKDCEALDNYADGILKDRQRYPKGVEDCPIIGGIALSMLVDRYAATHEDSLKSEARWVAEGLRNLVFNHRHPGYPSRGLNPADSKSIGALSSRDQVTHLAHGLWRWAKSDLADENDRTLASTTLVAVSEWMLRTVTAENDWSFGCADGTKDCRGVTMMRHTRPHEAARLASLYAATWDLTGSQCYRMALDGVLDEALADSEKFSTMNGDDLKFGVPDYALLQMSSSLEVLHGVVKDGQRLVRIEALLDEVAVLAAKRDADGEKHSPWLCGAAERPLARLMSRTEFPADARAKLFSEIKRIPFCRAHATRIVELSAAYWRFAAKSMQSAVPQAKGIVSFKDADKIKSWDAWDDHKAQVAITNVLQKEQKCVTWEKLNKADPGLKFVGRMVVRKSKDIKDSPFSIGCETMDRDYADWDSYKALLPGLGVKHARFFSGWAKTEQEKGKYDFSWLDRQIRECAVMGIKPWICISYGNPVWGSDFRLGMRVKQVTDNPAAFEAWLRYTKALVARYRDVVDEWEIWNEPFNQAAEYAEMFYRTAKAVREVQPTAKCYCTAIAMQQDMSKSDYAVVLEKLKREKALDLASYFIYHPYADNPDTSYEAAQGQFGWQMALPLREFVKGYSKKFDIMQGEVGCPSQLEFSHALAGKEWTEYSQAKWDLRRTIGDAVRSIPSSVFTMIDLKYTFMLQSFGLVRSNLLKEFVYRRPSYFAMSHVFNLLDCEAKPVLVEIKKSDGREITHARFTRGGNDLDFFWFSDRTPSSGLDFERVDLAKSFDASCDAETIWTDMLTGRIYELPDAHSVPLWDSPVVISPRQAIPCL